MVMMNYTFFVVIFPTWRQMANRRLPRGGRKDATKPAHAVPLASARQHLDVETQAGHSPKRAMNGPLECGIALASQLPGVIASTCVMEHVLQATTPLAHACSVSAESCIGSDVVVAV